MTLWLANAVVDRMTASGRKVAPLETGGILLGWRDGADRIVTGLIGPGPRAMHGRHAFVPDHVYQMAELGRAFAQSRGDLDYLGDWHTHPIGLARMSEEDKRTLRKIGRKVAASVMVIVDPSRSPAVVASWQHKRLAWLQHTIADMPVRSFCPSASWPQHP